MAEVKDLIESRQRVRVQEVKERISESYELAGLIGIYVNKLFDSKNTIKIPHIWDSYPELFKIEKQQYEEIQLKSKLEDVKISRIEYAQRHNCTRKKNDIR